MLISTNDVFLLHQKSSSLQKEKYIWIKHS